MNNTKSPKNVSLKISLNCRLFCALIGAVAGALVWILLKIMAVGTEFLWKWLPGKTSVPYYTIFICVAGAAIIGIFRKYSETIPKIWKPLWEKLRTEKDTNTKHACNDGGSTAAITHRKQCRSQAGLTGIIVGLCYWAGDNLEVCQTEYQKLFADWCRSLL